MQAPARGYDTWDGFGRTLTEADVLLQAAYINKTLNAKLPDNAKYRYLILDEGWSHTSNNVNWVLSPMAIHLPNPQRFPSSISDGTLTALSQKLRNDFGLDLGLWLIKGITMQAVELNLTLPGPDGAPNRQGYVAGDIIFEDKRVCDWHLDVYAINMSHPAAQWYYNWMFNVYGQWGVTYYKVDCIFAANFDESEIVGIRQAITSAPRIPYGTVAALSLSPGTHAQVAQAAVAGPNSNSYRITDDLYDCWNKAQELNEQKSLAGDCVLHVAQRHIDFVGLIGAVNGSMWPDSRPSWPDMDMIPVGRFALGTNRSSLLLPSMVRFVVLRWSIGLSPVILTGDLTAIPSGSEIEHVLGNPFIAEMHQTLTNPRVLHWANISGDNILNNSSRVGTGAWVGDHSAIDDALYLALFAFSDAYIPATADVSSVNVTVSFKELGSPTGLLRYDVQDLLTGELVESLTPQAQCRCLTMNVQTNDARAFLLIPDEII